MTHLHRFVEQGLQELWPRQAQFWAPLKSLQLQQMALQVSHSKAPGLQSCPPTHCQWSRCGGAQTSPQTNLNPRSQNPTWKFHQQGLLQDQILHPSASVAFSVRLFSLLSSASAMLQQRLKKQLDLSHRLELWSYDYGVLCEREITQRLRMWASSIALLMQLLLWPSTGQQPHPRRRRRRWWWWWFGQKFSLQKSTTHWCRNRAQPLCS